MRLAFPNLAMLVFYIKNSVVFSTDVTSAKYIDEHVLDIPNQDNEEHKALELNTNMKWINI